MMGSERGLRFEENLSFTALPARPSLWAAQPSPALQPPQRGLSAVAISAQIAPFDPQSGIIKIDVHGLRGIKLTR